jgi:hypothetical protein
VPSLDRPDLRVLAVLPEGVENREALVRPTPEESLNCADVKKIKPENLVKYKSAPEGKRLHKGCPT